MRAPRLLLVAASAALLAGCGLQKPTPTVVVVSGSSQAHSEAVSYCFPGQRPEVPPGSPGSCYYDQTTAPKLVQVIPGNQVGIDVGKELADSGWVITLQSQQQGSQPQSSGVRTGHYFAFTPPFQDGPLELQVRKLASPTSQQVTGVWRFVLAPA